MHLPVEDEGQVTPEPPAGEGRRGHHVAIVTGASRGIGRYIADALDDAGYTVERGSSMVAPISDRASLTSCVEGIVALEPHPSS